MATAILDTCIESLVFCHFCQGKFTLNFSKHFLKVSNAWQHGITIFSKLHLKSRFEFKGDVWVETSHMGFKYYCFLSMDGRVYEVTEWGSCQV